MAVRHVLTLFAVLGGFGLSGCFTSGVYNSAGVQPGQEILDGTIRNPEDWRDGPPPRRAVARRSAKVTIGAASTEDNAPMVYTDEWWAREKRINDRLNRQMSICRGC